MNKKLMIIPMLSLGLTMSVPAISFAADDQKCAGLDSGKIDTTGDPASVTLTAPDGKLIDRYCVKAGSANQGYGPVYVTVAPPVNSLTIGYPGGKAVSHYSFSYVEKAVESPSPSPSESTPPVDESPSPQPSPSETTPPVESPSPTPSLPVEETVSPSPSTPVEESPSPTPTETTPVEESPSVPVVIPSPTVPVGESPSVPVIIPESPSPSPTVPVETVSPSPVVTPTVPVVPSESPTVPAEPSIPPILCEDVDVCGPEVVIVTPVPDNSESPVSERRSLVRNKESVVTDANNDGFLPYTGSNTGWIALGGVTLVGLGIVLMRKFA